MDHREERELILDDAAKLISGDRELDYGAPRVNFGRAAKMWSAHLGIEVDEATVCLLMVLLKVSRLSHDQCSRDSWVDAAGYIALGAELRQEF